MNQHPRQTFAYVKEGGYDKSTRTLRAVISSANTDRHGEIVEPRAFEKNIGHYLSNPVVLAGHQHKLADGAVPVIGMVKALDFYPDRVEADIVFAPGDVNPLGPQYERAYELGFMRAFSVGFIPVQVKVEDGEPLRHTESELIELSAVAVGSNRESLSGSDAKEAEALEALCKELPGGEFTSGAVYALSDEDADADTLRARIRENCSPACKDWLAKGTEAPQEFTLSTTTNTLDMTGGSTLDFSFNGDPTTTGTITWSERQVGDAMADSLAEHREAVEAAADTIAKAADRIESAVLTLLDAAALEAEAEAEITPDPPVTPRNQEDTVKDLLAVLQKYSTKRSK